MTITTKTTSGTEKTYEIVSKIPYNFIVWNIGENMGHDEYIPLCQLLNASDFNINPKGEQKRYETLVEHVSDLNIEIYPLRDTYICSCEESKDGFWNFYGEFYSRNLEKFFNINKSLDAINSIFGGSEE